MRKKLLKRFLYLFTGEILSVIVFLVLIFLLEKSYPQLRLYSLTFFWSSFFLLDFLLVQGSMYWFGKWKILKKENSTVTPVRVIKGFKNLKKLNICLLIVSIFALVFDFLRSYPLVPLVSLGIACFIYVFAILEYINYFHFQLSYKSLSDIRHLLKSKRLKKSCLSKDFASMVNR